MDTRSVIEKYYDCYSRRDLDEWLTLISDDFVCDEQLGGHLVGTEFMKGTIDLLSKVYSEFKIYPEHIVVEGDEACVIIRCVGVSKAGKPIGYSDNPERPVFGANYFKLKNGKITYLHTLHDTVPFGP